MRWYYSDNHPQGAFVPASEVDVVLVEWALTDALEEYIATETLAIEFFKWGAR